MVPPVKESIPNILVRPYSFGYSRSQFVKNIHTTNNKVNNTHILAVFIVVMIVCNEKFLLSF